MSNPLENFTISVQRMKQESNLLGMVDANSDKNFLLQLAASEVVELKEEIEVWGTPATTIEKIYDELDDVWVLISSQLLAFNNVPDFNATRPASINGFGKRSNAFEKLTEMILGLQDNPEDIYEIMKCMLSIAKHLPVPNVMFEGFLNTIGKVLDNRPPKLYSTWDPFFKRILTPDEAQLKYDHLEVMTKMLRSIVNRKLKKTDWGPHALIMQNWQNAGQNQRFLQQVLAGEQSTQELTNHIQELEMRANAN